MRFKIKFSLPLFFLTFLVMACSLGSVSAANNIHDVRVDDTNTILNHWDGNIHDSTILNSLSKTDHAIINQGWSEITNVRINNAIISSTYSDIEQSEDEGSFIRDSDLNNAIINSKGSNDYFRIYQSTIDGSIQGSKLENLVIKSNDGMIDQASMGEIQDSVINNAIIKSSSSSYAQAVRGFIEDSNLTNIIYKTENSYSWQFDISNSVINNTILSCTDTHLVQGSQRVEGPKEISILNCQLNNLIWGSENTDIYENYLSGVNGYFIAIGCNNYTKYITDLTDTNFFNLVIGNHEICNWHW